jgi:ribosome recycling factor
MAETTTGLNRSVTHNELQNNPANLDNPAEIEAQIEQTRAQMGHTIDEIQVRLSPEYIKQQTQETIREATVGKVEKMANQAERKVKNWRRDAMGTVKENPIPVALIGIGLGWLLMKDGNGNGDYDSYYQRPYGSGSGYQSYNRQEGRYYQGDMYGDRYEGRDTMDNAKDWAGDKASSIKNKAEHTVDKVQQKGEEAIDTIREKAEHTAEQTQETIHNAEMEARRQMYRAKRTFWDTLNEKPLTLGIAALAAGAVVGLALPGTRLEDQLLGDTRDRLMEDAKREAKETARKVQNVAEQAKDAATEEAKKEAERQDLTKPTASQEEKRQTTGTGTTSTTTTNITR